jgi:transcriptional regulator with XRE-family HTH domain
MTMTKKEILAKLNSIAKPADDWLVDAKFRVDNQEWLKKSHAIALKILRKLRDNKANQIIPSTQVQLAEQLGVSAQQVNKWVKGKENFTIDTISKLEAALSIGLFDIPKPQAEIIIHKSVIESLIYSRRSKTEFKKRTAKKEAKVIALYGKSTISTSTNNKYALQS